MQDLTINTVEPAMRSHPYRVMAHCGRLSCHSSMNYFEYLNSLRRGGLLTVLLLRCHRYLFFKIATGVLIYQLMLLHTSYSHGSQTTGDFFVIFLSLYHQPFNLENMLSI